MFPSTGGDFTPNQRFFMSYAQSWVELQRDKAAKSKMASDVHSPGPLRVDGILNNVPEFYEAFDVRPGDKMYLDESSRVTIWSLKSQKPSTSGVKGSPSGSLSKNVFIFPLLHILSCIIVSL